jgi:peptidoglycan/xylan/chitin deacetylase (PgdA/CDA1 family)
MPRTTCLTLTLALTACPAFRAAPLEPAPAAPPALVDAEPPASQRVLALSFDDAPWMLHRDTEMPLSAAEARAANQALVDVLVAHGVQASVFFNCNRLHADDGTVEVWASAGMDVGNHSHSHMRTPSDDQSRWRQDVQVCHDVLTERLGKPPRWFRFPYLHAGETPEARAGALDFLASLEERRTPVTVATTEWMHAFAYRRAATDPQERARIAADYRTHMAETLAYADDFAQRVHGRAIPQIVLFHVNELAVDELDGLLTRWEADGWRFVSLDEVFQDPVYDLPEEWIGRGGPSWLWRVRRDQVAEQDDWFFADEEDRIIEAFGPMPRSGD